MPVRVELGPRDLAKNQALIKVRDEDEKVSVEFSTVVHCIEGALTTMQTRLLEKARAFRAEHSHQHVDTLKQLKEHIERTAESEDSSVGFLPVGAERMLVKNR